MRRHYEAAQVRAENGGYTVALDGRVIRSAAQNLISLPNRGLAEAIADEWNRQDKVVDFDSMPLTRLANVAIDDVSTRMEAVAEEIFTYGHTDLTCYRASAPADLVDRQNRHWQPLLDWIGQNHGVQLVPTIGVTPIPQPESSLAALRRAIATSDPFVLTGLIAATKACGSVVIALALRDRRIGVDVAWEASQLDETYQKEKWGEDAEAEERRARIQADLAAAAHLLVLCSGD